METYGTCGPPLGARTGGGAVEVRQPLRAAGDTPTATCVMFVCMCVLMRMCLLSLEMTSEAGFLRKTLSPQGRQQQQQQQHQEQSTSCCFIGKLHFSRQPAEDGPSCSSSNQGAMSVFGERTNVKDLWGSIGRNAIYYLCLCYLE